MVFGDKATVGVQNSGSTVVPLKGGTPFSAAGGAENAETPCGPVLKGNKKRPSVWPALHTEGTSALPGPLSPLGDYGQLISRLISLLRQAFDEVQNGLAFVRIKTTQEWHRVHGTLTFQRG